MGVAATLDRRSARLARLLGATALACLFAYALLPESAFAQTVADLAPDIPDGSEMLLEADTLIYDNNDDTVTASGSVRIDYGGNKLVAESGHLRPALAPADRQRQRADRRPRGHDGLFRQDRRHRRFRRRLRQRAARRDRRQDLFRRRKRRAARRLPDDVQQRRLHGLRALRGAARQGAAVAHQGQEDHLEQQGQDGPLRELGLRVLRPAARQLPVLRDRRPDGEAQVRLPVPGHQLQERPRRRHLDPLLFRAFADLRPDRHRHRLHRAGLPRRGRMAPALQQWRIQRHARRHQPGQSRRIRLQHGRFRARPAIRTNSAA